jgi:predicted small metal-binding protein
MKTQLTCPCGTTIRGVDEDELVALVQQHLNDEHDGRTYDREQILFMAS